MTLSDIYTRLAFMYGDPNSGEQVHAFSDKGNPHTYIDYYQQHFEPRQDRARILEIGVKTGGSLLLWSHYFQDYRIVGIDLSPTWSDPRPFQSELLDNPRIELQFGTDSTKPPRIQGNFDFVIDDGAHDVETQWATFVQYWPTVAPGGTYFIEDVVSESAAQELIDRIDLHCGNTAAISRYVGAVSRRADDQIVTVQKL